MKGTEECYDYTVLSKVLPNGHIDFSCRPLIDVDVSGDTETRRFKALVDSGTEITVLDDEIAKLLKIRPEGRLRGKLSGIEEFPKEGFIAPVTMVIDRFSEPLTSNVLFIENLHKNFEIILGQQDFFARFLVRFDRSRKIFCLALAPTPDEGK